MRIKTSNIIKPIAKGIKVGAKTNHQDQLINPVNFKAINNIVKKPKNPIPPLEFVFLLIFPSPSLSYFRNRETYKQYIARVFLYRLQSIYQLLAYLLLL